MWPERTRIYISPGTVLILLMFITAASPTVLATLMLAALCHELGHYLVLNCFGAKVEAVRISPFGVRMVKALRPELSYGQEMLAVAAGPAVNLLLSAALGAIGYRWEGAYLASGAHLILGLFNLLPVRPLDGGMLLWLGIAWLTDPFLADRCARIVGIILSAAILLCGAWLWWQEGSPFLLLAAVGLFPKEKIGKRTCKREKKRVK